MLRVAFFGQGDFALWEVLTNMTDEVQSICRKMEAEKAAFGAAARENSFLSRHISCSCWLDDTKRNEHLKRNSKFLSGSGSRFEHERCLHFEAVVPGLCLGSTRQKVGRALDCARDCVLCCLPSDMIRVTPVSDVPREGYDGQMKDTSSLKARST